MHSLSNPAANEIQAAYIRKVVDTVNDFDNVLYEVINEGGEQKWDWWVVETVRKHQQTKPKQHPIGITGHGAERLDSMLASPADWISPGSQDGFKDDPPAWDGKKVSLLGHGSRLGHRRQRAVGLEEFHARPQPAVHGPLRRIGVGGPLRSAMGTGSPQPGPRAATGQPFGLGRHVPAGRSGIHEVLSGRPGQRLRGLHSQRRESEGLARQAFPTDSPSSGSIRRPANPSPPMP